MNPESKEPTVTEMPIATAEPETVFVPQEPQEDILRDQPAPVSSGHEPGEPVIIETALDDVDTKPIVSEPQPSIELPLLTEEEPDMDEFYDDPAYDVLSSGQYLGTVLLMAVPVIGWLAVLIWALGGTRNFNRRNLARGVLFAFLIVVGVLAAAAAALYYLLPDVLSVVTDKLFTIIHLFQ